MLMVSFDFLNLSNDQSFYFTDFFNCLSENVLFGFVMVSFKFLDVFNVYSFEFIEILHF